jgi:molybdopterin converting factor small subunit
VSNKFETSDYILSLSILDVGYLLGLLSTRKHEESIAFNLQAQLLNKLYKKEGDYSMLNQEACTEERFLNDVSTHEMHIIKDDGFYRHIRFKKPESIHFSFDLITWPGHLCFTGDMQTFIFSRLDDMFCFFRIDKKDFNYNKDGLSINPSYWAEKLLAAPFSGRTSGFEEFSEEKFKSTIKEIYDQYCHEEEDLSEEDKSNLWEEINENVLNAENEYDAHRFANDFSHGEFRLHDFWEHNLKDYTFHYIWACFAIVWGINKYDEFYRNIGK